MTQTAQQHSYLSEPTWFVHYYNDVFDRYDQAGPFYCQDDAERFAERDCCMFESVEVVGPADVTVTDEQHAALVARIRGTIAHVTYYTDGESTHTDSFTGPHLLRQITATLDGRARIQSRGITAHSRRGRWLRMWNQLGHEAHVAFVA